MWTYDAYMAATKNTVFEDATVCKLVEIYQYFGEIYGPTEPESSFQTLVNLHSTNNHKPEDRIIQLQALDLLPSSLP